MRVCARFLYPLPHFLADASEGLPEAVDATRERVASGASVLLRTKDGQPFMTEFAYGKGRVLFVNGAIERNAPLAAWPVYRLAAERAGVRRHVRRADPRLGLTEHAAAGGRLYSVAVNSAPDAVAVPLEIDGQVVRTWGGAYADGVLALGANEGCVLEIGGTTLHGE